MTITSTDYISRHSTTQIINAFAFAEQNKTPLTAFSEIAWSKTDAWTPDQLPDRQEQFARRLRRWLEQHNLPDAYVYTVENGGTVGLHTAVAVHIPGPLFWTFVHEVTSLVPGFNGHPCTVKFHEEKRKDSEGQRSNVPKLHRHPNQRLGSLRYILKGIDPAAAFNTPTGRVRFCDHLGIRPKDQGTIVGRRSGVSHALGTVARARAGWSELTAPDELRSAIAYLPKRGQAEEVAS